MEKTIKKNLQKLIDDYGLCILEDPDCLSQFLDTLSPKNRTENFKLSFALGHLTKLGWKPTDEQSAESISKYIDSLCKQLAFSREDAKSVINIINDVASQNIADCSRKKEDFFFAEPGNLRKISGGIANKPRTMWLRKKSLYNGLILIVALLTIVVLFYQIGSQRNPEGDEFRIAFFATLSGQYASSGQDELRAAQLAVEQVNRSDKNQAYKLKIIGFDTPLDPVEAAQYIKNVMEDKSILAMMTGMKNSVLEAISPIADEIQVPLVITTPEVNASSLESNGKPYLYAFRIVNDSDSRAKMLAYFSIQQLNMKKIGIFYNSEESFGVTQHESLLRWIKIFKGEIKADIAYTNKSAEDSISAMKAIADSEADILILPNSGKNTVKIVSKSRESGFTGTILGEDYLDIYLGNNEKVFYNSWWINELSSLDPKIRSVLNDYRSLYNENCPQKDIKRSLLAYDAVMWIAASLYQASGYRGEAVRHALLSTRNFPLSHATLTIDPRTHGPLNKAMSLIYCDKGKGIFQKRIRTNQSDY